MERWPLIRDITLFLAGLLGVAHETLLTNGNRQGLLVIFAAMMGLPAFLRADAKNKNGNNDNNNK